MPPEVTGELRDWAHQRHTLIAPGLSELRERCGTDACICSLCLVFVSKRVCILPKKRKKDKTEVGSNETGLQFSLVSRLKRFQSAMNTAIRTIFLALL
jgi:hypothetical protein